MNSNPKCTLNNSLTQMASTVIISKYVGMSTKSCEVQTTGSKEGTSLSSRVKNVIFELMVCLNNTVITINWMCFGIQIEDTSHF